MTKKRESATPEQGVKTGRRENPATQGPRDKTVCFMLSEEEKLAVDRLGFCLNLTRSGLLANVVAEFVMAAENNKEAKEAESRLLDYLNNCRKAVQQRGEFARKIVGLT